MIVQDFVAVWHTLMFTRFTVPVSILNYLIPFFLFFFLLSFSLFFNFTHYFILLALSLACAQGLHLVESCRGSHVRTARECEGRGKRREPPPLAAAQLALAFSRSSIKPGFHMIAAIAEKKVQ